MRAQEFVFESQEIHNQARLDGVLERCLELLHDKREATPGKYGKVAACIIDMKNRKVFGVNSPGPNGTRRHAERVAIDTYHKRYGKILPGAIIVTTLSPCNRNMVERDGPSCQDLLMQVGIEKVYSGYRDPLQHSEHPFTEETTKNDSIWAVCKALSDSFVHDDLCEDLDDQGAAGIILYAKDTGRYGLQQRSDSINDGGLWAAWGGGRESGESLEQCACRELAEEAGYRGPIKLRRLAENARYVTFVGTVPHEFEPEPCDEWKDYCWVEAGDWPTPMHPGVAAALKNVSVNEAFDQPYKTKSEKSKFGDVDMLARLPDGTNLSIMFNREDAENDTWGVEFYRNNSQEVTGEGDAQRIFATVLAAIQKFIKKHKPQKLFFSASKELDPSTYYGPDDVVPNPESRAKLYDRLVQRYARAWGYRAFRADTDSLVRYELSRIKQGVAENFADGRHPEDKGDAKRHGINTKASVSSLRKTAKQGGRKGQLAHWLANMKAGRAKAKRK
jgi:8-oxo-dGTP pyrophosphatase MutT (NUDIX family)/pyrimidine deaminase RibD-like protein